MKIKIKEKTYKIKGFPLDIIGRIRDVFHRMWRKAKR